jgi:hypothetical protein
MNTETTNFASISDAVEAFIKARLADPDAKGAFTSDQLRFYVNNNVEGGASPGSSDRVLRMLRQQGKLSYLVLNRGRSLYRAVPLVVPDKPVTSGQPW